MISIAIEGNDGAGKSTLIKLLKKYYKSRGVKVRVLRYNMSYITLPAIKEGKKRKFSPELNTMLHYLSIKDQIQRVVKNDELIIWDRYKFSVYARGKARGVGSEVLDYVKNECPSPNATIYLDIAPEISEDRLEGQYNYWEAGQDVYTEMEKKKSFLKFQAVVRKCLKEIIVHEKHYLMISIKQKQEVKNTFKDSIYFINEKIKNLGGVENG